MHKLLKVVAAASLLCLLAGIASSKEGDRGPDDNPDSPQAEFHIARIKYRTFGGAGSHGIIQPWWAIDYPYAEEHFLIALHRVTNINAYDDSRHLELTDKRIFQYPFLFLQQPGGGNWRPTPPEAANLREHLLRGGFLLIDDLHGEWDWDALQAALGKVFPEKKIVDIPDSDPLMHIFYDLEQGIPIPGLRHLRRSRGGQIVAQMEGIPTWRGVYDDDGRLMIAINFNIDMGDSWEHADDPLYPGPMTATAYRLGVNYVIYAMTH
jgi:hypothetical protein